MGFYPDVKPGDPFKPSARLSNQVRHFFNGVQTVSAGKSIKSAFANNNRVAVINSTDKTLPAYTAIYVSSHNTTSDKNGLIDLNLLAEPATSDQLLWGITENNIEPDEIGMMVVSGVTQAYITGSGNYATPGANGKLIAGSSGKALILHPGDAKTPGIVQLGYSAGAVGGGEYQGIFKIVFVGKTESGDGEFEVINGFDPSSEFCGNTDLPDVASISRQKFTAPKSNSVRTIYLSAFYDSSTQKYSASLRIGSATGAFSNIRVGTIQINSSGEYRINQMLWCPSSSTYYYSRDYYL